MRFPVLFDKIKKITEKRGPAMTSRLKDTLLLVSDEAKNRAELREIFESEFHFSPIIFRKDLKFLF